MANKAADVLSAARKDIGYCRYDDGKIGTKFGRWYAKDHGSYYGTNGVPFCAMAVSYWFDQAGAKCSGIPEAYCPYILQKATKAGAVLSDKTKAKPGDVVLFNWDGGLVDHVGIVEVNKGSYIQTIEANTTINGRSGAVGRRTRAWSTVGAIIRPSYSTSSSSGSSSSSSSSSTSGKLAVDGYWGSATTLRLQQVLDAPYKDGVISRQNAKWKSICKACSTGWEWKSSGYSGSQTIKLLQKKVGVTADGLLGPVTINALIKYYKASSGATICDGKLDAASITVKAMQRALNEGRF